MTEEHKLDSAHKILIAARDEFAEFGLAGARVDRIAHRAGINKAMIYYHYKSKNELYQAVIKEHLEKIAVFAEKQYTDFTNLETLLSNVAQYMQIAFTQSPSIVPIFLREAASGGERIIQEFTRAMSNRGVTKAVYQMFEDGKARGEFRDVDTKQAIISFIGMNMFYNLMSSIINAVWEIDDEETFRKRRQKEVVELFLHGIEQR